MVQWVGRGAVGEACAAWQAHRGAIYCLAVVGHGRCCMAGAPRRQRLPCRRASMLVLLPSLAHTPPWTFQSMLHSPRWLTHTPWTFQSMLHSPRWLTPPPWTSQSMLHTTTR
eukprot:21274-Chlamydomonas_euryale.AAC.5